MQQSTASFCWLNIAQLLMEITKIIVFNFFEIKRNYQIFFTGLDLTLLIVIENLYAKELFLYNQRRAKGSTPTPP